MELIKQDLKYTYRRLTFIVFSFIVILFFVSQFHGAQLDLLAPPEAGQDYYGYTDQISHYEEMATGFDTLRFILIDKEIGSYPLGIYKGIKLTEEDQDYLDNFLKKMAPNGHITQVEDIAIDYEAFKAFLLDFDERMGGKTTLGPDFYAPGRMMSYEEAKAEYKELVDSDYSSAYGRLAVDYLGITAALFVPFLSAFILMKDKQHHTEDLIFSTPVNSFKYVLSKYFATLIAIISVYFLLAISETILLTVLSLHYGYHFEILSFLQYFVVWLLPTIMLVTASPMLFSMLFSNAIFAMVIQFVISYVMLATIPLEGNVAWWHLFIRFNKLGDTQLYESIKQDILLNRSIMLLITFACIGLSSLIWKMKRDKLHLKGN